MSYQLAQTRGAVFVLWGDPEPADGPQVLKVVQKVAAENGGKVTYVTRVPPGAPSPSPAARKTLNKTLPELTALCSSYHVVLEGEGFLAAFKRGVILSFLQPVWKPRLFYVHATCGDVLRQVTTAELANASALMRTAEAAGLTKGTVSLVAPKVA